MVHLLQDCELGHTEKQTDCAYCIDVCVNCGGIDTSLTTTCPGEALDATTLNMVHMGSLDFNGSWYRPNV